MKKNLKISICTVCMNRTYHLKQTLLNNIKDNEDFENLEFVLLNYDSQDDMEEWVTLHLSKYIEQGRLIYYKSPGHDKFNMAHSKNMVSRLATGDIVCLVDADNFTGSGYASYVHSIFSKKENIFITTAKKRNPKNTVDILGRVCFRKEDFNIVKGFDEFMNSYGYDDIDFVNRLELIGKKRFLLENPIYLQAIRHDISERLKNQPLFDQFKFLLTHHRSPAQSDILYLFSNGYFSMGTLTDNVIRNASKMSNAIKAVGTRETFKLEPLDWIKGTYTLIEKSILLTTKDNKCIKGEVYSQDMMMMRIENNTDYYRVTDDSDIQTAIYLHSVLSNFNKAKQNLNNKLAVVNELTFGEGFYYRNFNRTSLNKLS